MGTPNKITTGLYDAIKRLQKDGASYREVCEYFDISSSTVALMFKSETFEEYKNMIQTKKLRAIKAKEAEEQKEAQQQTVHHQVTVQATHYMQEELRKQTELLTSISNKLAFIVDELTK